MKKSATKASKKGKKAELAKKARQNRAKDKANSIPGMLEGGHYSKSKLYDERLKGSGRMRKSPKSKEVGLHDTGKRFSAAINIGKMN